MPNASVDIGGNPSGGLAAVAAVQGAIDGLTGKTVHLGVETSGGAALAGMASDMKNMANDAGRANRAAKSMGDHFERAGKATGGMGGGFARAGDGAARAGRAARTMGDNMERAGGHTAALAGHAERVSRGMTAIEGSSARSMKAIASGASGAAGGMRELEAGVTRTGRSVGSLSSVPTAFRTIQASASVAGRGIQASASIAGQEMKALESSANRAGLAVRKAAPSRGSGGGSGSPEMMEFRRQADGSFGVGGPIAAIGAGGGSASSDGTAGRAAFNERNKDRLASGKVYGGGAGSGSSPKAGDGAAKPFSWAGVGSDDFGYTGPQPGSRKPRSGSGSGEERPFSAGGAAEQLAARKAASDIDEVGKSSEKAGGSARSMGHALSGGLSGGLHSVERMIRPFQELGFQAAMVGGMMAGVTGEASKLMESTTGMGMNFKGMAAGITQAEQSAARSHNLGLNGMDQELRQTARGMTNELAPAMKAGVSATKAFEEAKMGAQASMGPGLEGFANQVTKSAPQLQGIMGSLGNSALSMGQSIVAGLAQSGPAFAQLAQSVAKNGPAITSDTASFISGLADVGSFASNVVGAMSDFDKIGTPAGGFDPWGTQSKGAGKAVAPGQFDPSKPFTGTAIGSDGTETTGTGQGASSTSLAPPRPFSDMAKAGGHSLPMSAARQPSQDAAWANGMTGAQVLTAERGAIGLGPVGHQEYSGHGAPPAGVGQPLPGAAPPASQRGGTSQPPPRVGGPGSSGGGAQIPSGIAGGLGMAQPMQSGAAQGASAGADLGGAMVQHVQKAVHVASAAASAGGQAIGGAMTGGAAAGITSTQTVTDTAIIKHLKKVQDVATGPSGIDAHSPSRKYDELVGRRIPQGVAQGVDRDSDYAFGAVQSMVGQAQTFGSQGPGMGQYAYANGGAPTTVSVGRNQAATPNQDPNQAPLNPMQSTSSTSMVAPVNQFGAAGMQNVQNHNDRAAQLAQGRADNHAIAMANLGAMDPSTGQRWQDPRKADSNPFAGQDQGQVAHPGAHGPAPRVGGPGSTGGGASMPSSIAGGLGLGKTQGPWAGLNSDLHSGMVKAGQNSTQGLLVGMKVGLPAVASAGGAVAGAGQAGYRKADKQASPSAVWAGMGGNSVAGVPVGFAAGVPAAVSAIGDATAQMSAAIAGPLNNQGLMLGYSYATNVVTGATTALKTANFQASGTPQIANQQAAAAVGQIGLLGAGSGASQYKTPAVSMDGAGQIAQLVTAITAAIQSQPIQMAVSLDGTPFRQMTADALDRFVEVLRDAST